MIKKTSLSRSVLMRRVLVVILAVTLCAVAIVGFAETMQASDKHFSLEAATAEAGQPALSIKDIAKKVRPSIVGITVQVTEAYSNPFEGFGYGAYNFGFGNNREMPEIQRSGAGSGIIISSDGYVLTNSHVVDGADDIKVVLSDGTEYDAKLEGQDAVNDVAVLKIDANDLIPAVFGDSSALEIGELAVAIGNPLGEVNGSVTAGIISAQERSINIEGSSLTLLQTDAAINPGNSGGALLNSFGEVIGLVNAKAASVQVEGIGYAIPINYVKALIENIVNSDGNYEPAMMGVTITDVDAMISETYNIPEGVRVTGVEEGSAAEKAGIQVNDTFVSLGGHEVNITADLNRIKAGLELGVPHPVVVLREGKEVELSIVLGEKSASLPVAEG